MLTAEPLSIQPENGPTIFFCAPHRLYVCLGTRYGHLISHSHNSTQLDSTRLDQPVGGRAVVIGCGPANGKQLGEPPKKQEKGRSCREPASPVRNSRSREVKEKGCWKLIWQKPRWLVVDAYTFKTESMPRALFISN